ncbi:MAG: hypothetical protein U0838_01715 [Chloroflexota bacterium]
MRSPVRVTWRSAITGVKLDECAACGRVTAHRLVRQYRWLEVGPVAVLPLGLRHGLECGDCWTFTPVAWRTFRAGLKAKTMPLPDRARPHVDQARAAGQPTPDLDRVVPSGGVDGGTFYLGAWAVVIAVAIGLLIQPTGKEGEYSHSPSCLVAVGVSQGQPVPTPPLTVSETLCVLPHNFEPLVKVPLSSFGPSASMPPYPLVVEQAAPACAAAFRAAFGSPGPDGPVAVITGPDSRDWARGERFTWCAAADPNNPWRTSSLPR